MSAEALRRLLLLRHGETPWNAELRWQGQTDIELSETGHLQAKGAATVLAGYEPVALWCSDLARAAQTAAYVAELTGLPARPDARLRETSAGEVEGLTADEILVRFGTTRPELGAVGGESADVVADRVAGALREAGAALAPGETAVVVSHGTAIRHGLSRLVGWPVSADGALGVLANCGWAELVSEAPDGPWRLTTYNRQTPIS
ncbi:histidine phosphatase family protein [Nocardioides sp. CER19]|uniref:histidine phosphatase family protein n=1 Tax=Nocardioides sp. CER19 TaxID=3038538 RepID=UPI00244D0E6D|nr:histidine phosphatase family protein [Nocardioides sp. CER19]MDH2415451.1 histidine phosphatase family protein [Nocardioides sp. CER19]